MRNIWIVSILFILSCSISKETKISKDDKYLEEQIKEFKIEFFKSCIASKEGATGQFLSMDFSTTSDFGLGLENYKVIDSLANMIKQKIHTDSLEWTNQICGGCDEETLQRMKDNRMIGKKTLKFCLDYYTSTELDSIARANVKGL